MADRIAIFHGCNFGIGLGIGEGVFRRGWTAEALHSH